ncbi:MAG: nitrogen fixation protein NifZ [Xanthobacteraceae bacterium]|jgi:nitrogen fixation protein NifZ
MSEKANAAVRRVCCDARSRRAEQSIDLAAGHEFLPGEEVRSLRPVKNDGVYPHKDIGEILVQSGDAGIVRERWSFLGNVYYTVEFVARATFVIMRGREMIGLAR